MKNNMLKKGLVVGIIVIFICASFVPSIGGYSEEANELDIDIEDVCELKENVLVTCNTFGFPGEPSQEITMSLSDAEFLYEKIKELQFEVARDPLSDKTQQLQREIITLADEHNLLPAGLSVETLKSRLTPSPRPQHPRTASLPRLQNKASEMFCNYVSTGSGTSLPIIILPRLIPILLTPIPRLFVRWKTTEGITSCGGLRSGTGFIAYGAQNGIALGFWGIGFSIFLPPVMAYGLFGYALFASVNAEEIELWPPNYPPEITVVSPLDGTENVPISTSELSFHISDFNEDPMSYSVTTTPDIGSGSGTNKPDGTYTVPISGLEGSEEYTWQVEVSDGVNNVATAFTFTTEPVAPIVSNPNPGDGAYLVPVDLSELRFHLRDPQGDLMGYTVETVPDIGSGSGTNVNDGFYSVPISGLDYLTNYKWYVNVTDGTHWKHEVFTFQTEMIMVFNPFDEGWQYRKNITIDHTQVSGDLQDFTVLISITDTDLRDKAQPDGDDILFMDGTGTATRLFHETEHYDGSTGELIVWVKLPQIHAATDTKLCMYYGHPTCNNQQFPIYVWDDHYKAVWHMTDEHDSTANSNDLTNYGATAGESGQIYQCYRFDGLDDYMLFPDIIGSGKPLSIEIWGNIVGTNAANDDCQSLLSLLHEKHIHVTFHRTVHEKVPPMCMYTVYRESSRTNYLDTGENSVTYGSMNSVVSRIDEFGTAQVFLNGIGKESVTGVGSIENDNRKNVLGAWPEKSGAISSYSYSYIDEVRISNTARDDDWIITEYRNQNNPSGFMSFGPEETGP